MRRGPAMNPATAATATMASPPNVGHRQHLPRQSEVEELEHRDDGKRRRHREAGNDPGDEMVGEALALGIAAWTGHYASASSYASGTKRGVQMARKTRSPSPALRMRCRSPAGIHTTSP